MYSILQAAASHLEIIILEVCRELLELRTVSLSYIAVTP